MGECLCDSDAGITCSDHGRADWRAVLSRTQMDVESRLALSDSDDINDPRVIRAFASAVESLTSLSKALLICAVERDITMHQQKIDGNRNMLRELGSLGP